MQIRHTYSLEMGYWADANLLYIWPHLNSSVIKTKLSNIVHLDFRYIKIVWFDLCFIIIKVLVCCYFLHLCTFFKLLNFSLYAPALHECVRAFFWISNISTPTKSLTLFPNIVSSLKWFPPLKSFLSLVWKLFKFLLHKGKLNVESI